MKATSNQVLISLDSSNLKVVIDKPKGSRSKFKYDEDTGFYELVRVLPTGAVFPFNFGFLPATLGEDGNPLDVLLLMEEPLLPGSLVDARLIGMIGTSETAGGTTVRNDRLVAVVRQSRLYGEIGSLDEVGETLLRQIEEFVVAYHASFGRELVPVNRASAEAAAEKIHQGMEALKDRK
jgi:inorganic pyrophosphatase